MTAKDLPPEERLLRLIKGRHKKEKPSTEETKPEAQLKSPTESSSAKKETPLVKPSIERKFTPLGIVTKGKRLDPFKTAVFLLIGFFIIGVFYFAFQLFGKRQEPVIINIEELIPPEEKREAGKKPAAEEKIAVKEEEEEKIPSEMRELFGAPVTRETPSIIEKGPSIIELAKNLVLVGVITGDSPQAIIQDKKTRQTFYAYEGESVLEFKIKKIEKATVILERDDETLKLSL